jgi:hypothetical protein
MSVAVSLFADVVVACLLITTIVFCLKLNKRIRVLQDSKSELAQLIEKFDQSTMKATHSINEIHKASKKISENMQARLDKANFLADDLAFMIEKGSKLADRMEGGISTSRTGAGAAGGASSAAAGNARSRPIGASEPEISSRESLAAAAARPSRAMPSRQERDRAEAEQAMAAAAGAAQEEKRTPRRGVRMRSKAEQDLLDAMKAKK